MILKAVVLFLVAMLALGAFGKLRSSFLPKKKPGARDVAVQTARKCPVCDAYVIGSKTACGRADCPASKPG